MFVRIKQKNTVMIELEITKEYINPFFFISHFCWINNNKKNIIEKVFYTSFLLKRYTITCENEWLAKLKKMSLVVQRAILISLFWCAFLAIKQVEMWLKETLVPKKQ